MQYDISVIIPTYNAEKYITHALDSVVNQNFTGSIEIILIDDCSTDNTPNIIKEYKEFHSDVNINIFFQEKNMRQGTARNRGLNEAKGKYIFFLDGDDFLDCNAFEKMFARAEEKSCDFVLCDWAYYYEDKGLVYVNNDLFVSKDFLFGPECEDLYQAGTYFTVNKLYNKDFLLKNNIRYGEGYIYEDFEFYVKVAQYAEVIGIVQNPYYRVRVNEHSTTKTDTKSKNHIESFLKAVQNSMVDFAPRGKYSYYQLNKHLIQKAIYYSENRAPFGYKKKTLRSVLEILNNKNKKYKVPENVITLNHFYFRRKLVQRGKVNSILFVHWLQKKKKLEPLFQFARKQKQKITSTNIYKKMKQKKFDKKVNSYYNKPIDHNTILFLGFDYRYVGNSRYFLDYLLEKDKKLNIYFVTKDKCVPKEYRVSPRSLKFYEVLAKAKVVIAESWVPLGFKKRPGTTWIQLWHGTPFKKVFFDSHEYYISKFNRNHKKQKQKDISKWDFLLADSEVGRDKLSSSFAFDKDRILNFGYPRIQWLKENKNNTELKNEIRTKLGIPEDKKVILYVPTWRDYNYKKKNPKFSYLLDLRKMSEKLESEFIILNKQHSMETKKKNKGNFIITPSEKIEVQHLLLITDYIISDYSSIIFDGMAIDIPFYLYINDFEKYEKARGVYPDMHEVLKTFYVENETDLVQKLKQGKASYPMEQFRVAKELYSNNLDTNSNNELYKKIKKILLEDK
jgi:CDP-glycerol glycerophosphotransferase